jgi:hypothetical protein
MVPEKALSFHAKAISCFNKGKLGKGLQFGRAFQLGRIGGNFLMAGSSTSLRMEDTDSVRPIVGVHQGLGYLRKAGQLGVGHVLYGTKFNHEFSPPAEDRPTWDIGPKAA